MARTPTPTSRSTILLQPQASPVDTFVQPPPSGLQDLMKSLATFDPQVRTFLDARAAEEKEAATKQADADFVRSNQAGYAEATRRGIIPAHMSPTYVKRYKELEGDALGRRLRGGFLAEYESWGGRNGNDPAAINGFVGDYLKRTVGTDDPDILAAARPHIMTLAGEATEADSRYRSGRMREEVLRSSLATVNSTLDDANYDGISSGAGTDYAGSADAIERQRAAFAAAGGDPAEFDRKGMELIAAKAVELKDPKLLDFFDRKVPGSEYTYGDTAEGSALRRQATEQIAVDARQETLEGDRAAEKDRKAREAASQQAAVDAIVAGEPVPEEVLKAGEAAGDPLFRTRIGEWRDSWAKGLREPRLVREIEGRILAGGGMKAALEAVGELESSDDVAQVMGTARTYEAARPTIDGVLGSTAARTIFDTLATRTKSGGGPFDPVTGVSNEGLAAQYDFRRQLTDWAKANPGASEQERDDAISRIGAGILSRLRQPPGLRQPAEYDRDTALDGQFPNPFDNLDQPAATGTGAPAGTAGLPASMGGAAEGTAPDAPPRPPMVGPFSLGLSTEPAANPLDGRLAPIVGARPPGLTDPEQVEYWGRFSAEEREKVQRQATTLGKPLGDVLDGLKAKGFKRDPEPAPASAEPQAGITPISYRPDTPSIADISSSPTRAAAPDLAFLSSRAIQGAERSDSFTGMRPEFASGLEAMLRGAPPEIASGLQVMSGYRSPQRQAELWAAALRKYGSPAAARKWVAPPGRSGHNHGHAADLAFNGQRLDKAPRRVREWVHANAAAYGLAFPLGNEAWHVELAGARNGKGQAHIHEGRRSFTRDDAEAFLQAAMMSDPLDLPEAARDGDGAFVPGDVGAGRLLDLIGQHESAGNYNAVFGNADSTRDLGQLTLSEIIEQQRRSKRQGAFSTAIGKYQFLRKTLESLRDELGLTGNERFDPELQDRLAVTLLERRGYRQFKAGKLSARAFALRLSQEWSSVEKPGTGRSYYAGDGFHGNAPVKTREVYAALGLPSLSI